LEQQIVIVNPDSLLPCAPGEVGEIWLRGGSVAQGYWNRPDETEATFHARIAGTGDGPFLRTGDLGCQQAGELFVTGRLKDLLIIRGRNHYPQDIEGAVERCDAALRPGCGAAFTIGTAGAEAAEERLVIVQEVDNRSRHRAAELIEKIRAAIAEEHELAPFGVALIKPGGIPKTSSGKIQRRACREAYLNGELDIVAQWQSADLSESAESPVKAAAEIESVEELEAWLQDLAARRLNTPRAELDTQRPLAHYGLDSLGAVELAHEIETALGLSVVEPLQSLALAQIAALAFPWLAGRRRVKPEAAGATRSGPQPLSHGQRALFFLQQFEPQSSAYNIANAARIRSAVDVAALRRAFQSLVDRHSILRATFGQKGGEPWQQVQDRADARFNLADGAAWTEEQLRVAMETESNRPFDLSMGPLLRVSLFARGAEDLVLLLVAHHIAADLWSLALWLRELGRFYDAELAGQQADLPPVAFDYLDFAEWHRQTLASEEGRRLEKFWNAQLAEVPPPLALPVSRAQAPETAGPAGIRAFTISPELAQTLKAMGREQNATLYVVLLAALQALLRRFTGQEEFLIGSPTSGRNRVEWAGLAGYLVNPVILRADLAGDPSFVDALARARQTAREALAHQEYPFAFLAERLRAQRESMQAPPVQVMFVMQQTPALGDANLTAFALGAAGARIELGGLTLEALELPPVAAQFPLTLTVAEHNGGIAARWNYDRSLFDAESIDWLTASFQTLLAAIADEPGLRISRLPLLDA
jgi:acyl carrier protein